ncbi:DUF6234 family protein [Streptomyces sp. NPDC059874]|uniref:DUF6234 family protein n=1 Tax=Streptomyces sp. NPDC059874 TaxID=3346983 RepID=UPI00364E51CB
MTNQAAQPARPPAGRSRAPMHWATDLILALLTGAGVAVMLVVGVLYAAVEEFGLLAPTTSSAHQWQGIPRTAGMFLWLGFLCAVSTLAAFGFRRMRAPLSTAVHGVACVLLLGLMLLLAGASETAQPQKIEPDPAATEPSRQCRSGGDNSECPGG